MITLVKDTINKKDIDNLIEWLKTYPRLTKGPVTHKLEEKWSNIIGSKYSVFCNSGSSANLLMLHTLLETNRIKRGSKVIVPALAWATDLSPVMQLGLDPLICDINLEDLSVDLDHLESLMKKDSPKALMLVSVLGLVPDMDKIVMLCKKYNVILLEDACESMGSKFRGQNLGTFGLMSSFSTYFGHHISTIEGGFISTDDFEIYEVLKAVRSHGWDRDLEVETQKKLREEWETSNFNALYTFYYSGLNLRSTDLQAYIGLSQVDRLAAVSDIRNYNFNMYNKLIENDYWKVSSRDDCFISNFAYPVIHPNRNQMVKCLIDNNVEVRPLICGSMTSQPFYTKRYGRKNMKNCSIVDKYGFYLPNHPSMKKKDIELISAIINKNL
jgi:CDP-4-dehydro-6-deoxyglucose reductase, E1